MNPIAITDILNYRFLSSLQAAPEGEKLSFTLRQAREAENDYSSDIYLYESGKVCRMTSDGKSAGAIWEDDTHLLFPAMREEKDRERAQNGENFSVWYRLSTEGGEAEKAFELPASTNSMKRLGKLWFFSAQIDRANPDEYKMNPEEKKALAERRKENADYHILTDSAYRLNGAGYMEGMGSALFTFDPASGVTTRFTSADQDISFANPCGDKILYGASQHQTTDCFYQQVFLYDPATQSTEMVYGNNDLGVYDGWLVGDKVILLATNYQIGGWNQNPAFYTLQGGAVKLLVDPDAAVGCSVGTDCRLGGGAYARVVGNELYYTSTVESRCELRKLTASGKVVTVNSAEGSLDCFAVTGKGNVYGVGLFQNRLQELYAIGKGKKVACLTSFNQKNLAGKYVAVPKKLTIRSALRRIDGWVLLPKDYDPAKRYPAVLDIHGGPKTVYGEVLYHEMQVWASRGYFVFFCNPTGSDGRGNAFMDIRGKYGTVDYKNIMDFTDAVLKAYPQIDPERIAVTGGSYGGFMTNWIIGHTNRFACAASQRSISNWFSFYGASDIGISFNNDQNAADIFTGQKEVWNHSPLKYAINVTTPTLFIHSEEDYRCPIDQGLQMYAALLEKGIDTRFVWFKGENHDLSRSGKPKHRIKRLTEITDWIEKYTKI